MRKILPDVECPECRYYFSPKRESQRFCSVRCRNGAVARASAATRGATMRGRTTTGSGRYPKLMGEPAHRRVAGEAIGRKLEPHEVAHHLNGRKDDFRPCNLIVISSQSAHARISKAGLDKKTPPKRKTR